MIVQDLALRNCHMLLLMASIHYKVPENAPDVRNALMTLDFVVTIMHYVTLYHFMVMLSSCDPLSCHAFDFCVLQVIINFLAASAG